ncbi:MAG: DUF357 domain-containing protein [archaeon]|nr:DUF357 domain-containing protein [archaeon]MCR4323469.1 DUF357 domain-containing protein [Nanoarchaeota archaeon]
MQNEITLEKVEKYFNLTETALVEVKEKIIPGMETDAHEIIEMVTNYISDAHHFEEKEDLINAFAALNYAHGWLDSGVRLGIFDVHDDKLFTVK